VRLALSAAVLLVLAFALERGGWPERRVVLTVLGIGTTVLFANQLAIAYGVDLSTASTAALAFGTMPILAALMERGRHGGRHWVAATISFGGVALIALGAGGDLTGTPVGIGIAILGPVTFTLYSVLLRPYTNVMSTSRAMSLTVVGCVVPFLLVGSPQLADESWSSIPPLAWVGLASSALIVQIASNILWFRVLRTTGTVRASVYVNLQPFFGALFGVVLLGERLTGVQIVGGVLIGLGIVVARWQRPLAPEAA
jgi:drug/metabolite transporter (DMT)-like permease